MSQGTSKLTYYAPVVLRLGMALVFLWFGTQQFLHTDAWTGYVPEYATAISHMSASTLVMLNATVEVVFGLLLVLGIWVRVAAIILALHMLDIMITVGYGEIGVRDFGLMIATAVVALNGADILCIHGYTRTMPHRIL